TFELDTLTLNIKSFKEPHFFNKIIYNNFRKSKAKRSFEYATYLLKNNIGTPQPIAFFEKKSLLGLKDSYYVSEHLDCNLTYRELVQTNYPDTENILRQFIQFTFLMHQKGIEFLDHSPGNTLIVKTINQKYNFYLVDLNRMKFHKQMNFKTRMKNLSKLTPKKDMVLIMSSEYAKLSGIDEEQVFTAMWKLTQDFQYRFYRKKRLKKSLKFWKKQ
ncbi:lipopolysaccharide kinase InaA family protein, partial [uncultured Flavobacterium sp.]|uniref:lipopolysaccharide kinase InaA family protein n=1 Tax=uncultured Flavobacterium sp. TaxID=165435 RepID=UPI0030CA2FEE